MEKATLCADLKYNPVGIPEPMSIPRARKSKKRKVVLTGSTVFLLLVLAFVIFIKQNFSTIEVKGESMEPTFHSGDHVIVSRAWWLVGDIKPNDIVVIREPNNPSERFIKRVYRTGGEKVDFFNMPSDWSLTNGEYIVPAGQFYVLGDNRPVSEDSRNWGPIGLDYIVGKVVIVRWGMPARAKSKTDE